MGTRAGDEGSSGGLRSEPKGLRTPASELSDEELLERYKSLMGFDLKWETQNWET